MILLVSNSSDILNYKIGDQINQFDKVVRFNNFETKGYEEFVGTKTDWICYRACDDVKLVNPTEIDKAFFFVTWCKWTQGMKPVARQQKAWFGDKGTIVDEIQCFEIAQSMGLKNDLNEWPSTGALALGYFSKIYPNEIMTHGFYTDTSKHYFSRPMNDGKYHQWEIEKKFLQSLKIPSLT